MCRCAAASPAWSSIIREAAWERSSGFEIGGASFAPSEAIDSAAAREIAGVRLREGADAVGVAACSRVLAGAEAAAGALPEEAEAGSEETRVGFGVEKADEGASLVEGACPAR